MTETFSSPPSYATEHLARLSAPELWQLLIRNEDRVPRHLIDACVRCGDAVLDQIEALLQKQYYWDGDVTAGEWWLPLHAAMILGLIPSHHAGELLVACMRRLDEAGDESVQEWLAAYWPALSRNKPETIVPLLRTLAEDRVLDWYMRAGAVDAVVAYAEAQAPQDLDEALSWAAGMASDASESLDMRVLAGNHLLDFARAEHRQALEALADLQPHIGRMFGRQEINEVYAAGGAKREWERFSDPWAFYDPDNIEKRRRRWAEEDAAVDRENDLGLEPGETYVRPGPKIGRNDPCPCGSGKKYKKCCLVS